MAAKNTEVILEPLPSIPDTHVQGNTSDALLAAKVNANDQDPHNSTKPHTLGNDGAESRYKLWLRLELVGLVVVIFITWGLFALPIVFYHLPVNLDSDREGNMTSQSDICPSMLPYSGSVCKQELTSLSKCLPSRLLWNDVLIRSDQSEIVRPLLDALGSASDDCKAAALPFLCVYFFGLCDSTGKAYRPSSSHCTEISTGVCAREWTLASNFLGATLPDCASFPNETILIESCDNAYMAASGHGLVSGSNTPPDHQLELEDTPVTVTLSAALKNQTCTCNEDFYCKQTNESGSNLQSVCVPECGSWEQYSGATTIVIDALVIMAAVIGVISGIVVFVIAGAKKKILVFPSVIVVYQTVTVIVLSSVVLVSYMDRTGLYCSSKDLFEALTVATPFCVISGIVFHYTLTQIIIWWIFHTAALFWKIQFPFHAHKFESIRFIHCLAIVLALVIPAIPVIITMIEYAVQDSKNSMSSPPGKLGFGFATFPPIVCVGNRPNIAYYLFYFPINVITFTGVTLLVLIFRKIHKQHGLFRVKRSKNLFEFETAERKILIVFCYYVILIIFILTSFAISHRNTGEFSKELIKYFLCERSGPNTPCSREEYQKLTVPELTCITTFLFAFFPFINLMFVVNYQEVKEKFQQCLTKIHSSTPSLDKETTSVYISSQM